jgi:hypothetical protein
MPADSFVYFVRVGEHPFVKIGRTTKLNHRLTTLQTGHWEPFWLALVMPGCADLERELHARFKDERCSGEWFSLSDRLERFIRACEPEHQELRDQFARGEPMTETRLEAIMARLEASYLRIAPDGV